MDRIIFYSASLLNRREREPTLEMTNTGISQSFVQKLDIEKNTGISQSFVQKIDIEKKKQKEIIQTEKQFNNLLNNMRNKPY